MKRLIALIMTLVLSLLSLPALAENVSYGGAGDDVALGMIALSDGGWLVYGSTTSTDGDFARAEGDWTGETPWAMRLDESGGVVWHFLTHQSDAAGRPLSFLDAAELADGRIALLLNIDSPPYQSYILYVNAQGEELVGAGCSWEPRFLRICASGNDLITCGEWDENKGVPPYVCLTRIRDNVDTVWGWGKSDSRIIACAGIKKVGDRICTVVTIKPDEHPYAQAWLLVMNDSIDTAIRTNQAALPSEDLLGGGLCPVEGGVAYVRQSSADKMHPDGVTSVIMLDELMDETLWEYTLNKNTLTHVAAMPVASDEGFVLAGYTGGAGDVLDTDDKACAQYVSLTEGYSRTLTQSNTSGGKRFVDAMEKDGAVTLLGIHRTGDKGVDAFMDTWDYLKNE